MSFIHITSTLYSELVQVCRANIEAFSIAECIACHGTTRFYELTKEKMVWVVGDQVECVVNQQGQVCTEQTRFYFNWPRRLCVRHPRWHMKCVLFLVSYIVDGSLWAKQVLIQ